MLTRGQGFAGCLQNSTCITVVLFRQSLLLCFCMSLLKFMFYFSYFLPHCIFLFNSIGCAACLFLCLPAVLKGFLFHSSAVSGLPLQYNKNKNNKKLKVNKSKPYSTERQKQQQQEQQQQQQQQAQPQGRTRTITEFSLRCLV